jgi:uncharacterized oxidoreductase
MNITGNKVFITGGGSGIGLAVAEAFLAEGNRVVISGRDPEKLAAAKRAHPELITVRADITDEADVHRVAEEFADTNILVNNAGVGRVRDFRTGEGSLADLEQEIATNLTGTIRVTGLFLPHLLEQPEAAIVSISSALAIAPLPTLPVYSATKAAIRSFSTALRYQLRDTPVQVFEVLPTFVDTPLTHDMTASKITPDTVARSVLDGIRRNTNEIFVGQTKAVYRISRLSPALAQRLVTKSMTLDQGEPGRGSTEPPVQAKQVGR